MSRPRRRFVSKTRIFTEQRRREFAEAGFPLVPEDQLLVLEDYLDISRRRSLSVLPLFKLQLHMLQDLVIAEKAIGSYKRKLKEMSGEPLLTEEDTGPDTEVEDESAAESTPSREGESVPHGAEIRAIKRELYFLRSEVRSLRDIADGIAWRLFDYDRAVLHELARRPAGRHINSEGLLAELYTFAGYANAEAELLCSMI